MGKWLQFINTGCKITTKTMDELISEYGSNKNIPTMTNSQIKILTSKPVIYLNKYNADYIKKHEHLKIDNIICPLFMLKPSLRILKLANKSTNITSKYSITSEKKDEKIIQEMISLVDKDVFRKLLSIGCHSNKPPREDIVNKYLEKWAIAKYDFFLLFGKKLSISKTLEYNTSEEDMRMFIDELVKKYPRYFFELKSFSPEAFINNKLFLGDCEVGEQLLNENGEILPFSFNKNMKLSKFLSKLLRDSQFDIELSKILQNKKVKGTIAISIDPCDYITMSITKNKWNSCYNPVNGCYPKGAYSVMLDKVTLVSFRHNDKLYEYSFFGNNFSWNSKQTRMNLLVDLNTSSIARLTPVVAQDKRTTDITISLIKDCICKYTGINSNDYNSLFQYNNIFSKTMFHHMRDDYETTFYPKNINCKKILFTIGHDKLLNPITGKIISG